MSSNMNNMKQAVYELFGVGSGTELTVIPAQIDFIEGELAKTEPATAAAPTPDTPPMRAANMSFLASGTVFEGTLRSAGDVEIAGEVKGDVSAEGTVSLFSSIEGSVNAGNLTLANCTLVGNATVAGTLTVGEKAKIEGDIRAKEVLCAGTIDGNMDISGNATLEHSAKVRGNIVTGSFAVEKGATICGGLEIKGR